MSIANEIEYFVGAEKRLPEVLDDAQVLPLLKSAVKAGIGFVAIVDDKNVPLWTMGTLISSSVPWDAVFVLVLEGEPIGSVCFLRGKTDLGGCRIMADLIGESLNSMLSNNLKRMLTTEIHTRVVNQSYDELLEKNRRLRESEKNYRDLAETLELRIQERTEELKRAYARLIQQEKMASVGQLAAGVAHEINNPIGYVISNLNTLRKYLSRTSSMLEHYRGLCGGEGAEKWRELKLDFVLGDINDLLDQSISGAEKVKHIVSDLKGFSHVEGLCERAVDIHYEINRTLSILNREIPKDAKIVRAFGYLPFFEGNGALLCQVFMNLLRNAVQAKPYGLELTIATALEGENIRISFSDNGPGIPDNILGKIFDPFFTTRDVGQGTGLGLTVAHDIVTAYKGTIDVENLKQGGSSFIIQVPAIGRMYDQVR